MEKSREKELQESYCNYLLIAQKINMDETHQPVSKINFTNQQLTTDIEIY